MKNEIERKQIMKITYTEHENGFCYPNLTLPIGTTRSIGEYGRLYLGYLKKYRRGTYTTLLTENRLNEPLHRVDIEAKEMALKITEEIVIARGIGEHLKTADPIRWVQEMNNCKACAEEIVLQDFYE